MIKQGRRISESGVEPGQVILSSKNLPSAIPHSFRQDYILVTLSQTSESLRSAGDARENRGTLVARSGASKRQFQKYYRPLPVLPVPPTAPGENFCSAEQLADHMAMHVRQAPIDAVMAKDELRVIDPEQVQNGRVDIVNLCRIFSVHWLVTPLVAFPVCDSALDATAAKPVRETIRIVVAPFAALAA